MAVPDDRYCPADASISLVYGSIDRQPWPADEDVGWQSEVYEGGTEALPVTVMRSCVESASTHGADERIHTVHAESKLSLRETQTLGQEGGEASTSQTTMANTSADFPPTGYITSTEQLAADLSVRDPIFRCYHVSHASSRPLLSLHPGHTARWDACTEYFVDTIPLEDSYQYLSDSRHPFSASVGTFSAKCHSSPSPVKALQALGDMLSGCTSGTPSQNSLKRQPYISSYQDIPPCVFQQAQLNLHRAGSRNARNRRARCASKVEPYHRQACSRSISEKPMQHDDPPCLGGSTPPITCYTPWAAPKVGSIDTEVGRLSGPHIRSPSMPLSVTSLRWTRSEQPMTSPYPPSFDTVEGTDHPLCDSAVRQEEAVVCFLAEKAAGITNIFPGPLREKARALWVHHWLLSNYTCVAGFSVARQELYQSYTISCGQYGIQPVSPPSFGKAVHSACPALKTRRIGARGNSKYHYVSIRPALYSGERPIRSGAFDGWEGSAE